MTQNGDLERLRIIKSAHEADLMSKANVVGVGIGLRQRDGELTNEPVIVVSVVHKTPLSQLAPDDVIPRELEGVPVDVQAVGKLRAFGQKPGFFVSESASASPKATKTWFLFPLFEKIRRSISSKK